ncbi:hypothetical protein [Novipirellula rosea]|uniref:DUF3592 domain-containing protein n=2 Tax=Novipirellula TaxID=2795426 RepID=A0ABP8MDJ0_9BACT
MDEYFNVDVGEEFHYEAQHYRKLDERRSALLAGDKAQGKVIHFYPEDEVLRRAGADTAVKPPPLKGPLPARSDMRNILFLVMIFGLAVLLVGFLLLTIASLIGAR